MSYDLEGKVLYSSESILMLATAVFGYAVFMRLPTIMLLQIKTSARLFARGVFLGKSSRSLKDISKASSALGLSFLPSPPNFSFLTLML